MAIGKVEICGVDTSTLLSLIHICWAPKDTNEEFFSMDDLIRIFDENGRCV